MPKPFDFSEVTRKEQAILNHSGDTAALCLSGGGIRSATFGLGVLQGLARLNLLGDLDYISTVSGGGYIGGWLSAWRKNTGTKEAFQGLKNHDAPELRHLRRFSNYLSPQLGIFSADTWTLGAIFLRNLMLNLCILLPMLAGGVLAVRLLVATLNGDPNDSTNRMLALAGFAFTAASAVFAFSMLPRWLPSLTKKQNVPRSEGSFVLLHTLPMVAAAAGLTWSFYYLREDIKGNAYLFMGYCGLVHLAGWALGRLGSKPIPAMGWLFITALGVAAGWILHWLTGLEWVLSLPGHKLLYATFAVPIVIVFVVLLAFLFVGLSSYHSTAKSDSDREWWARSAAWLMISAAAWLAACGAILWGPYLLLYGGDAMTAWYTSAGGTLSGALAALAGWSSLDKEPADGSRAKKIFAWVAMQGAEKLLAPLFVVTLLSGLSLLISRLSHGGGVTAFEMHRRTMEDAWWLSTLGWAVVVFGAGYVIGWALSVNRFSLNGMYRNRLIRAYLGASNPDRKPNRLTGFDERDNILMSQLAGIGRPIPIVNVALNVTSGGELAWQQRQARSFIFSPLAVGFGNEGDPAAYQLPEDYTDAGGISLGSAIAISGAAASPNMGYHSSKALAFLMAIFNVRLGAWLANPRETDAAVLASADPNNPLTILNETFSRTNDTARWIYLSDGGHFDNLGLYEMVKRRVTLIVVNDASADPKYQYDDLTSAIQKLRVDLGVEARFVREPNLHNRRDGAEGLHWAVIELTYPHQADESAQTSTILYIKPSFCGREKMLSPDVYKYAAANPDFPHQSTGDQFFNEDQFESYRRLGEQCIEELSQDWKPCNLRGLFDHAKVKISSYEGAGSSVGHAAGK